MATTLPLYYPQPPQLNYNIHPAYQSESTFFSPDSFYQQPDTQPPADQSPEESLDPILALNLRVLRRHLPGTASILFQAQYAVIYTFSPSGSGWEKSGKEGTLFIVRESSGACALVVLNRRGLDNFVMRDWDSQVQSEGGHIILRGREEGERVGVGAGAGEVTGVDEEDDLTVWGVWIWEEEGLGSTKGKRAGAEAWLIECAKEREAGILAENGSSQERKEEEEWETNGEVIQEEGEAQQGLDMNGGHNLAAATPPVRAGLQQPHQQWENSPHFFDQPQHHQNQQPRPPPPQQQQQLHQTYPSHLQYPQYQQQHLHPFPQSNLAPHAQNSQNPQPHLHQHSHSPQPNTLPPAPPQQYPTHTLNVGPGSPDLMALLNGASRTSGVQNTAPPADTGRDILGEIFRGAGR